MIVRKKSLISKFLWSTLIIFIGLFHFVPLFISINVAFKPKTDLSSRWVLSTELYLRNFIYALNKAHILMAIKNSIIITTLCIGVIVLLGGMAAYPLARNRSRFNDRILQFVLAVMMVPPLSMLVPLVTIMTRLDAVSTYWGISVVLVTFQLPISIFLYANFIRTIPAELDEAALIDGCNKITIFYKIILPLLKPVTATVIILTGVAIWNDYQFSLFLLQSPKMKVVTLAVSSFFAQSSSDFGSAAAAALIAVLPVTLLFLFLQRYFIKGMVDSAVKG